MSNSSDFDADVFGATYLAALVSVEMDGEWTRRIGAVAREYGDFYVVTAWNPGSERFSDATNRNRNAKLREEIGAAGGKALPARGADPASSYAEDSWAVWGLDRDVATANARAFDQVAIFLITPNEQVVLGCQSAWSLRRALDDTEL